MPGGRFAFLEHVAAPGGSLTRVAQAAARVPWRRAFEGCDVTRDTEATIRAAGFSSVEVERTRLGLPGFPADPIVAGIAVR